MRNLILMFVALSAVMGGALLPVVPASALAGTFLTLSSQPGDPILNGGQLSFTPNDSSFTEQYDGSWLVASINSTSNGFWQVNLAAPPGTALVPGTYTNAVRAAFRGPGQAGLDVFGNGVGCNQTSGSFTVNQAVYGANNYVQTFDATFIQFCDNATAALTGEISISNPPPPPALSLGFRINSRGTVDVVSGLATVTGTLSCNEPVTVFLSGSVVERVTRFAQAQGSFGTALNCTPGSSPMNWTGSVMSFNSVPFGAGQAQVNITAGATDPAFGNFVTQQQQAVIVLTGKK